MYNEYRNLKLIGNNNVFSLSAIASVDAEKICGIKQYEADIFKVFLHHGRLKKEVTDILTQTQLWELETQIETDYKDAEQDSLLAI